MNKQSVFYTTSDVARKFGVRGSTVRRWVNAGMLVPAITTPGGHHKFSPETIDAFEEELASKSAQRSQASA